MFGKRNQMMRKLGEYINGEPLITAVTESYSVSLAKSNEMLAEKIEADVKARDRVNISLEDYNDMRNQIRKLETENHRLKYFLEKIHFPFNLNVVPDTICTRYNSDPMDFMVGVEIRFKIDDLDFRNAIKNGEISL